MSGPSANNANSGSSRVAEDVREPLLAKVKRIWLAKTDIDARTARQLFKGALAPTICMAAYQGTAWANEYTTLGYLVTIASILSTVFAPRAKFLQNLLANIIATCAAAAVVLLAMFCSVKARVNSVGDQAPGMGGPGTSGLAAAGAATSGYNSSASAIAGFWLFVLVYGISVVRAKLPQYTVAGILAAIFANVGMVYAPQFSTMEQSQAFAKRLLTTFLTGFGVAAGVSLLIFPFTCRQIVFKEMESYLDAISTCLAANVEYMHASEDIDVFSPHRINTHGDEVQGSKEVDTLKAKAQALSTLHAKLNTDLPFAKREVALGKLGPDDLKHLARLFRSIMIPTAGLSSIAEIFQRIAEELGWDMSKDFSHMDVSEARDEGEKARVQSVQDWHELMRIVREPFEAMSNLTKQGLEHAALVLQLKKPPRKNNGSSDAEKGEGAPLPGDPAFPPYFDQHSLAFVKSKKEILRGWCEMHSINVPDNVFDEDSSHDMKVPDWMAGQLDSPAETRLRRQLFVCLYMHSLFFTIARRTYDLIMHVEELRVGGKLSKTRLIVPGLKTLRKWLRDSLLHAEDGAHSQEDGGDAVTVYLGDAYTKRRRDPEHLAPTTLFERYSNKLRSIAHFFASPASAFGFRVACATMTIGVVAFLQDTQALFTRYRLFWAQIMIAISMTQTFGQSLRAFLLRLAGTVVYFVLALVAYYIVDRHIPGVIIFYALFVATGVYIILKYPANIPVGMIGAVTLTLIVGYELQVRKVGVEVATSNGQEYQPIYILGLLRVATVCGGLLVAWIWTIFPYPITEHSQLRSNLGKTLYLLANYYSVMHETFRYRLQGDEDMLPVKERPGYRLDKARNIIYSKCNILISSLRNQVGLVKLDLPVGGKFPKTQYEEIVGLLQSSLNFMSLVVVASGSFADAQRYQRVDQSQSKWVSTFRQLVKDANITSQSITTLLSLLSASITNGQALPPFLKVPEPTALTRRLDELDRDILSIRHIAEPGYASFSVVHVSLRLLTNDLRRVLELVKELVGELDFSFHIETNSRHNDSEETLTYSRSNKQD